jgi:hypothetical protein
MKLFHNVLDKFSRDYMTAYGSGKTIIDWYNFNESAAKEWIANPANPSPSMFPGVLLETEEEYHTFVSSSAWVSASFAGNAAPLFVYPPSVEGFDPNIV